VFLRRGNLIVLMFCVLLVLSGCGIKVTVINDSNEAIKNVEVVYNGGKMTVPKLESKSRIKEQISPKGESDLELKYRDHTNVLHVKKVDVYFESGIGYSGDIVITVDPNHDVTWISTIGK
jgi:hypothetical protein